MRALKKAEEHLVLNKTRLPARGELSPVGRESPPTVPRARADALWRGYVASAG